jgi:IS5 family transposase
VRGRLSCGYCAAKDEKVFGWRLPLTGTPSGVPVRFAMLPGALHDLTPLHELTVSLPPGARLFGDKGYNSAADAGSSLEEVQVRLIPVRRKHMKPHAWFVDEVELRA